VFHVLFGIHGASVVSLLWALLVPGGVAFVMTGNASVPPSLANGPVRLTAEQLVSAFENGGFTVHSLTTQRFDETAAYGTEPPLAWRLVARKPDS
jgi:hypothetical protein